MCESLVRAATSFSFSSRSRSISASSSASSTLIASMPAPSSQSARRIVGVALGLSGGMTRPARPARSAAASRLTSARRARSRPARRACRSCAHGSPSMMAWRSRAPIRAAADHIPDSQRIVALRAAMLFAASGKWGNHLRGPFARRRERSARINVDSILGPMAHHIDRGRCGDSCSCRESPWHPGQRLAHRSSALRSCSGS